jgi:hypothetical protein
MATEHPAGKERHQSKNLAGVIALASATASN